MLRVHGLVVCTRAREASCDAGQSWWGEKVGQAWAGKQLEAGSSHSVTSEKNSKGSEV